MLGLEVGYWQYRYSWISIPAHIPCNKCTSSPLSNISLYDWRFWTYRTYWRVFIIFQSSKHSSSIAQPPMETVTVLQWQLYDWANGCLQFLLITELSKPYGFKWQLQFVCMWVAEARLCFVSSVWLRGRAVVTLFLTLVPVLVYLLSGMWSYVSLNLSESTCPSVTWATGQHTHRHTRPQWHTDKQLNDMASLVSHTVDPNCAHMKKHNLVYTPLNFTTHTAHTSVKDLHPAWAHCVLTCTLLWPITRLL